MSDGYKLKEFMDETELTSFIISKIKGIVKSYDREGKVVLYGSRARGDNDDESDWDFLILLSSLEQYEELKESIRKDILYQIEFKTLQHISTVFQQKEIWMQDCQVTTLFRTVAEEGVEV